MFAPQRVMTEVNEVVSNNTNDLAQFSRIAIPLVRRVYPSLIANNLVSVQPLQSPTGLIYYLRHRYSEHTADIAYKYEPREPEKVDWKKVGF